MNPAKRKKLYRLKLVKKLNEEKVTQKEVKEVLVNKIETKVEPLVEQQTLTTTMEYGLKLTETTEQIDSKKEKKKKSLTQDS